MRLPKNAHLWLGGLLRGTFAHWRRGTRPTHLLFAVCDHYEPHFGGASNVVAEQRVRKWIDDYPGSVAGFRDSDGRSPAHTFFYPAETYTAGHIDTLKALCARRLGEVEVHLHHDDDTAAGLRRVLTEFRDVLAQRHGLLAHDSVSGGIKYGFIHGNWALDNSRADGRYCGVNNEIDVLVDTGCYADFTMPAAPDTSQSRTVNQIYYAVDDPARPRSHDRGQRVAVGLQAPERGLLMIQGPLRVTWAPSRLKPVLENGALDASIGHRPTLRRLQTWIDARVTVAGRDEWVFVKIYTHGAPETNAAVLLGEPMRRFHTDMIDWCRAAGIDLHYVTAREMANVVLAAAAGESGSPGDYRDFRYKSRTWS